MSQNVGDGYTVSRKHGEESCGRAETDGSLAKVRRGVARSHGNGSNPLGQKMEKLRSRTSPPRPDAVVGADELLLLVAGHSRRKGWL